MLDEIKEYIEENPVYWGNAALDIFCIVYLCLLGNLNSELAAYDNVDNVIQRAFSIVGHNNGVPVMFFIAGVALIVLLGVCLVCEIQRRREERAWRTAAASLIVFLASTILNVLLIITILAFLNNPIMWAVVIASTVFVASILYTE